MYTSFVDVFFLMIRRPPRSTRTDTLFPYTTLFRSEGLRLLNTTPADVVLLDIGMPKKNGYEALMAIKAAHGNLPVLIITSELEQFYASQMISNGAHGYFQKHGSADQLIAAIREIFDNKQASNQKARRAMATEKPLHEQLSAREYEVFY